MKNVRMYVGVLLLSVAMLGCKKEELKDCTCGVITDDEIESDNNGNLFYSLTIKNDCTNNVEKFYFSQDVWFDAYVGSNFCVLNTTWMPVGETTSIKVENKVIL
jgi:hypothetical protein